MAYDAAAVLAALERPSITVPRGGLLWALLGLGKLFPGTKTYEGRILSEREFLPFRDRFIAANEGTLSESEIADLWEDYLRAIGIPPRVVFRLPPAIMQEALESFFVCQLRASAGPRRSTSGSDSRLEARDERKDETSSRDTSPRVLNSPSSSATTEPERTSDLGARLGTG